MFSGIEGIIIVKARQDPVGNLLNNKLFVAFTFLPKPKNAIWMFFHIVDVLSGMGVLFGGESDGKAGFYFMCVHSEGKFAIVMPFRIVC